MKIGCCLLLCLSIWDDRLRPELESEAMSDLFAIIRYDHILKNFDHHCNIYVE